MLRNRVPVSKLRSVSADANRKPSLGVICCIWALIVFSTVPEGFDYSITETTAGALGVAAEGNSFNRIIWLICLGVGAAMTLSRSGATLKLLRNINPFFICFIVLAAASTMWSLEPAVTLRRIIRVVTIFLDATAIGIATADPKIFQKLIRPVITVLLAGSIVFVLLDPKEAVEQSTQSELKDAWHGLTLHKNELGSLSAIACVFWWHAFLSKDKPPFVALLGLVIAGVCLVGSRSSTSLMAATFACFLLVFLLCSPKSLKRYLPYAIGTFIGAILVYSLAVLNLLPGSNLLLSPITMVTGKDLTFSGRTPIWNILNQHIALSPIYGSGYAGYWNLLPESPSMEMLRELYFYPSEGHNGYLDVINDLGFLGAVCLFGYVIAFLREGLFVFKTMRSQGALYLALLFEQLIGNLSESRWFNAGLFDFIILTTATVIMARTAMELRANDKQYVIQQSVPARRF